MTRTAVLRPYSTVEGLNPLIAGRWSSRALDRERAVEDDVMNRLFEAARWAPSAMNSQPWLILSFGHEDSEQMAKAQSVLNRGNSWALNAPRLLFFLAILTNPRDGSPYPLAEYETGMAALQMSLQAAQEGLVFHQMAGFNKKELTGLFSIKPEYKPLTAVALGYPGFIEEVPEEKRAPETAVRTRKELEDLVIPHGRLTL